MITLQLSLIFAFLAMIFWGLGDFLIQKTIKKVGDFQTLLWINLIAGFSLIPFIIQDLPKIFSDANIISLVFMTVIDLCYSIFLFKAYKKGKLAVIEMIMIGELPFTIILGLIFFGEKLSFYQFLVILMIVLGIILISKNRSTWWDKIKQFFGAKKRTWEKGALLTMVAFIFSAVYNFLTAVNARNISAFTAVWFPWMLSSLFLLLYIIFSQGLKSLLRSSVKHKSLIILTGLLETVAWLFYAFATSKEQISTITAIVAGYAVIAMLLGVKFNKERLSLWQSFGMILVGLGVFMISFVLN